MVSTKYSPWIAVLVAGLALPGCVTASKYYALQDELAKSQDELAYLRDTLAKAEDMLSDVDLDREDQERLKQELARATQEKQELLASLEQLRAQEGLLTGKGLSVIEYGSEGLYGYRAEGDVFFSSGSSELTVRGKEALDLVIKQLKSVDAPIRIDGHTDTDPVNKTKDKYPAGNIELGAKRAIAVREYLIEKGIPSKRIGIASFAEYRPVASGTGSDAKAKNRRVEIMLQMANTTVTEG